MVINFESAAEVLEYMNRQQSIIDGDGSDRDKDSAAEEIACVAHWVTLQGTKDEKDAFRQSASAQHIAAAARRLTRPGFEGVIAGMTALAGLVRASKGIPEMLDGYTTEQISKLLEMVGPDDFVEVVDSIKTDNRLCKLLPGPVARMNHLFQRIGRTSRISTSLSRAVIMAVAVHADDPTLFTSAPAALAELARDRPQCIAHALHPGHVRSD